MAGRVRLASLRSWHRSSVRRSRGDGGGADGHLDFVGRDAAGGGAGVASVSPHRDRGCLGRATRPGVSVQHVSEPRHVRDGRLARSTRHRQQQLRRPGARPLRVRRRPDLDRSRTAVVAGGARGRGDGQLLLGRLGGRVAERARAAPLEGLRHGDGRDGEGRADPRMAGSARRARAAASHHELVPRRRRRVASLRSGLGDRRGRARETGSGAGCAARRPRSARPQREHDAAGGVGSRDDGGAAHGGSRRGAHVAPVSMRR